MLALPVVAGLSGFLPAIAALFVCWLFMTCTGLLFLEACSWFQEGTHLVTMTQEILGDKGKYIVWLLYSFIAYCSLVAYTSDGSDYVHQLMNSLFSFEMGRFFCCFIFVSFFALAIFLGQGVLGRLNTVLFIAMILSYLFLLATGVGEVQESYLMRRYWGYSWISIPVMITTFSYQGVVPSLMPYLQKDIKKIRSSIVCGTSLTFFIYALWLFMVLGVVPFSGELGLSQALKEGKSITYYYQNALHNPQVALFAQFFSFFAITTSFLGIGLGLYDFLADGLKLSKRGRSSLFLIALICVPSWILASIYPQAFFVALDISGGFGDSILNGFLISLIVWIGRYRKNMSGPWKVFGGKWMLALLFIFSIAILAVEILEHICHFVPIEDLR